MRPSRESLKKRAEQLTLFERYSDRLDAIEKTFAAVYSLGDRRVCIADLERYGMDTLDAAWFVAELKRVGLIDGGCAVLFTERRVEWLLREARSSASRCADPPFVEKQP
jgi:hypothetical protein